MLGAEIPDGALFGLIPLLIGSALGLMAWIVRELGRIDKMVSRIDERLKGMEEDGRFRQREIEELRALHIRRGDIRGANETEP